MRDLVAAGVTADMLCALEAQYSGGETQLPMRRASPHDPRGAEQIARTAMLSGYRMANRGYAPVYAEKLARFDRNVRLVIVEIGVLCGVGLAVWCDVFPAARVIGLEYDTGNWNEAALTRRGAFRRNVPEVHWFDKLDPDAGNRARAVLAGETIDILIDDAVHSDASVLKTVQDFEPLMAPDNIVFIEDNRTVYSELARRWPGWLIESRGAMTVVSPR